MNRKYETFGGYTIFLDDMYYLCYAGGYRELSSKDQKEWNKTLSLPGLLRIKEQHKLGNDKNPNMVPLRGRDLLQFIKEMKFVPFFDRAFESTHTLQLNDLIIFESIKQKSYDIAMRE